MLPQPTDPPPPEATPDTCREYLGRDQGTCPRPAHTTVDSTGMRFCWPHAHERTEYRERAENGWN